jgi:hypothetical protein
MPSWRGAQLKKAQGQLYLYLLHRKAETLLRVTIEMNSEKTYIYIYIYPPGQNHKDKKNSLKTWRISNILERQ